MKANNTGMLRKGRMLCNSTTVDRKPHVLLVWLIVLKFLTFSVSYLHAWTVQRLYWIRITSGQRSLFIEKSCKTQNNMKHLVLVSPFIAQADEMKHRSTSAACRSLFEFCFSLMHPSKVRNPPPPPQSLHPCSLSISTLHLLTALHLGLLSCLVTQAVILKKDQIPCKQQRWDSESVHTLAAFDACQNPWHVSFMSMCELFFAAEITVSTFALDTDQFSHHPQCLHLFNHNLSFYANWFIYS